MADTTRNLVRKAFFMARQTGKSDWQVMTVAVLKNRLLQLTGGQFSERDEGFETFREFVLSLNDTVRLDASTQPATVVLVNWDVPKGTDLEGESAPPVHIRQDLWRALLDVNSGRQYVWDPTSGEARERKEEDTLPTLPTLTPTELDQWRKEFHDTHFSNTSLASQQKLTRWYTGVLPATFLPRNLQGHWIRQLTSSIEKRLQEWFAMNGLQAPTIATAVRYAPKDEELIELRATVIDYVQVMTRAELEQLKFPATVLLRAKRKLGV